MLLKRYATFKYLIFRESAKDQKEMLFQIFSYIRTFQNWIIGEVSWLQSILYYIVTCILSALFSASKKTADARISLFTILSFNVVIERMLVKYCTTNENEFHEDKVIKSSRKIWHSIKYF